MDLAFEPSSKYLSLATIDSNKAHALQKSKFKPAQSQWGTVEQELDIQDQSYSNPTTQLFIGGMSNTTDLKQLQEHIKHIVNAPHSPLYISVVKRLKRKTFSGYGIIKNIEKDKAKILLEIANFKFHGCWFGVKPFLKNKSVINYLRNDRAEKKVYLKGLTEEIDEADLETYFNNYGGVLHVQIGKHQFTNAYKGFGFIEFNTREAIELVVQQKIHRIRGVDVNCEISRLNNHAISKPNKDTDSNNRFLELPCRNRLAQGSKGCCDPQGDQHPNHYIVAEHHKSYVYSADKIASNHTENNLMFRIPCGVL